MSDTNMGVIFDLDGVLIDSSEPHRLSWVQLAEELGSSITDEQFRQTFGRQNRDIIPILFGDGYSVSEMDALGERKERYYREIVGDNLTILPGGVELARACSAVDIPCAIGSSGHPLNIQLAIEKMGIADCIRKVVTGHDVSIGKPHPEVFLLAAMGLECDPSRCVVIEDAPAGVEAGVAGGMKVVAVTTEHAREKLTAADLIVKSLEELTVDRLRSLMDA